MAPAADSLAAPSRVFPVSRPERLLKLGRPAALMLAAAVALAAGVVVSVMYGPVELTLEQVWAALFSGGADAVSESIVWNLRLPRALAGVLIGLNLAVSGALLQGTMRNPLAAPNIIGVTAGAGLAATLVLVLATGLPSYLPLAAFAGALVAALFVYSISWQPGSGTSPVRMVLAGVAVTSMLGALTTFLMVYFSDRVQPVILWMSGNLVGLSWQHLYIILPYTVIGLIIALILIPNLNVLQLGEETATGLGVRVEFSRLLAIGAASLLAASAVSVAGLVGFVGLMVPHIMRLVVGHNHAYLIPASAIGGGLLLVWADFAARGLSELPVGILTAMLGGPYFVFLLYRKKVL